MKYISKTIYLEFIACAKNAWLKQHRPDLADKFTLSAFEKSLLANGNLVESWARKLFPSGTLIEESGSEAAQKTSAQIKNKQVVIFQATFIFDKFLARNDVLEYDAVNDVWNIYEIKGTNTTEENNDERDHIEDATFQYIVARDCGLKIGKINIIHLNKEYIRGDEINVNELFTFDDISEQVLEREERTKEKMRRALEALFQKDEKALSCDCLYFGRNKHCSTFKYSHPEVPEYSVHDLSRIGLAKKKLADLVDAHIFDLTDIPDSFPLSAVQKNQLDVYKSQVSIIDKEAIKQELEALSYPLYFLDYETYPPAIPLFKGFKPYQHIPFQFSLHVLPSPNGELKHFEYIHLEQSDPTPSLIKVLQNIIGPEGSVIVWNKAFEESKNIEMAQRHPESREFLEDVNSRIYDLMDIFQKQFYVHPGFKGRVSIKKVLPVLAPELSYQELTIKEGASAMEAWFEKIFNASSEEEKKEIAKHLLDYCRLDTYAMYAILLHLTKTIFK